MSKDRAWYTDQEKFVKGGKPLVGRYLRKFLFLSDERSSNSAKYENLKTLCCKLVKLSSQEELSRWEDWAQPQEC